MHIHVYKFDIIYSRCPYHSTQKLKLKIIYYVFSNSIMALNLRKVESYRHPESSSLIALSYQSNKYLYVSLTKQ